MPGVVCLVDEKVKMKYNPLSNLNKRIIIVWKIFFLLCTLFLWNWQIRSALTLLSLSHLSMVRTVYSVSLGAIRIQRGLLPVVEMDSGKSWPFLLHCIVWTVPTSHKTVRWLSYKFHILLITVSSGRLTAKSSISTNILLLYLDVTGAKTTSKTLI